jgi:hypothetical protein
MKKISGSIILIALFALMTPLILSGCGGDPHPDKTVARINDYHMSINDFKSDLETTFVNEKGTLTDEEVLDLAIKREILVQEAQRQGIDREKSFMKTIERYWKQALIRELVNRKSRELAGRKGLSDDEKNKMMQDWYDNLYKNARIQKNARVLRRIK